VTLQFAPMPKFVFYLPTLGKAVPAGPQHYIAIGSAARALALEASFVALFRLVATFAQIISTFVLF
jgi:hypothetical protein